MAEEQQHSFMDIMNSTLQELGKSIAQQSALSINSLNVSEFSGSPNEDVHEFLKKFKLQTLTLSDEQRCHALVKALKGWAINWAKANIKDLLLISDWKGIKDAMVSRFGPQDKHVRYMEKLNQLKYEDKTYTLMAYVETFVLTHQKAFPSQSESDSIQALRWNLPDEIVKGFNQMDDKWTKYDSLTELYDLVQRYERNILPFEKSKESEKRSLDPDELKKILTEFKESMSSVIQKKPDNTRDNNKQLAIITHQQPSNLINRNHYRQQRPKNQFNPNNRYQNKNYRSQDYQPYRRRYYNNDDNRRSQMKPNTQIESQRSHHQNNSVKLEPQDPAELYFAKFGKPPVPCKYCQGNHLNRHCPMIQDNLN